MSEYRKKPVVIEAWKVPCFEYADPIGKWNAEIPTWLIEAEKAGGIKVIDRPRESDWAHIEIVTLEGTMLAGPGDWIIRGIKQELYPCKDDVFQKSYEAVE